MSRLSVPEQNRLAVLAREIRKLYENTEELANAARNKCNEAVAEALLLGNALNEAKRIVGHGNWLGWLKKYCPIVCERTAQKYMRLAKTNHGSDLESGAGLRRAYIAAGIIQPTPWRNDHNKPLQLTQDASVPAPAQIESPPAAPNHESKESGSPIDAHVMPPDPLDRVRTNVVSLINILRELPPGLKPQAATALEPLALYWQDNSPELFGVE